jgi:CheY-like chemotaxis protein
MGAAGKRVLLVDDDVRTVRRLAQMLREDGFAVDVACEGASAIARLGRAPCPDVLVTDVLMPYADGVSLVKYARSLRPHLPIIYMTGYPNLLTEVLEPSPVVLVKPIDYSELAGRLRDLVF